MEGRKDQLRKKIYSVIIAMLVGSIYFSAMLVSALTGGSVPGPFRVLKMLFTSKGTLLLAILFFVVGSSIACYTIYKTWKASLRMDKMGRFKAPEGDKTYGDAHFEEPEEYHDIAQIRPIDKCRGTILAQLTDDGSQCLDFTPLNGRINAHMMVFGASGSGKSYTFVKNKIFQMAKKQRSIIITDPDGGLYRDMALFMKNRGYVVRQLNFSNPVLSDGWDCMKSLFGDNLEVNASIFAHVMVANTTSGSGDSIYVSGPESLLTALILRVILGTDYPPEKKNIKSVYELLQNQAGIEYLDTVFDPLTMPPEAKPSLGPYLTFKQASKNLAGNLVVNLATGLKLLQNSVIADLLSTDNIDLLLPGQVPCAYFCQFPDSHDTFRFLTSLFFTMLFIVLIDYADNHTTDGRLPVPVEFILDEFPSIGIIPDWQRKMATIRKRAMNATMICQDITQLQQNYLDSWPTILANCGTVISLGINEEKTAKWFSTRLGETSVETESKKDDGKIDRELRQLRGGGQRSVGIGKRSLLSVSELQELGENETLIVFQRHGPIWANMVPHTLHPFVKELIKLPPTDRPGFQETERREKMLKEDEEARAAYWAVHDISPLYDDPAPEDDEVETDSSENPLIAIFSILAGDTKSAFKKLVAFIKKKRNSTPKVTVRRSEAPRTAQNTPDVQRTTVPTQEVQKQQEPACAPTDENQWTLDDLSEFNDDVNINDDPFADDLADDYFADDSEEPYERGYQPEMAAPAEQEPEPEPESEPEPKPEEKPAPAVAKPETPAAPRGRGRPPAQKPNKPEPEPAKAPEQYIPKLAKMSGTVAKSAPSEEKGEKELSEPAKAPNYSAKQSHNQYANYSSFEPTRREGSAPPLKSRA